MTSKQWREEEKPNSSTPKPARRNQRSSSEPRTLQAWMGNSKKAAILAFLTAAIVFLAFKGYEFIQPKSKVEIYLQFGQAADTTPFSGNQSQAANWNQIQGIGNGVSAIEKMTANTRALGPNKDVVVYFVTADATISNGKLLLLENDGDIFKPENWRPLSEILTELYKYPLKDESKSTVQRVLLLDICQIDSLSESLGADIDAYLRSELETLAKQPGIQQEDIENLWVLSSVDRVQSGWYSPEVGSSIFSFFVGQGLRGWSPDADGKLETISLLDLADYVADSVDRWAKNARDSRQHPILYSLKSSTSASQAIELNFRQRSFLNFKVKQPDPPAIKAELATAARLDELWGFYDDFFSDPFVRKSQPQLLAFIENRLLRMEQIRYAKGAQETLDSFELLTTQVDRLLNRIETRVKLNPRRDGADLLEDEQCKTVLQILSPVNKPATQRLGDPSQNLDATANVEPTDELQDSATKGLAGAGDEKNKAIKDKVELLNQKQRVDLIWVLLQTEEVVAAPLTSSRLDDFEKFVRRGKTNSGSEYRLSLDDRFQYFLLLKNNTNVDSSEKLQKAFIAAIRCRNASNKLISNHSNQTENDQVLFWKNLEPNFEALENQRRRAEDRLFAGSYDFANDELLELIGQYQTLRDTGNALTDAWKSAKEVLFVAPRLRSLLVQEAIYHGVDDSNPLFSSTQFERWMKTPDVDRGSDGESVPEVETVACDLIKQILEFNGEANPSSAPKIEKINIHRQMLDTWLGQVQSRLHENYQSTWSDSKESAARNLLQGVLFLRTSLPEYLSQKFEDCERSKIRANLDERLRSEGQMMADIWPDLGAIGTPATEYLVLNGKDTVWISDPPFWTEDVGIDRNGLADSQPTSNKLDSLQAIQNQIKDLLWRDAGFQAPSSGRVQSDEIEDVGIKTAYLAIFAWELSKLNRAWRDLWGRGVVSASDAPPFVELANASLRRLRNELVNEIFEEGKFPKYSQGDAKKILQELTAKERGIEATWKSLQEFKIVWDVSSQYVAGFDKSNDPDELGFSETQGTLSPSKRESLVYQVNLNRNTQQYPTEVSFRANLQGRLNLKGAEEVTPEVISVRQKLGKRKIQSPKSILNITPLAASFSENGAVSPNETRRGVYVIQHPYGHVRFALRGHWFTGSTIEIEAKTPPEEIPVIAYELPIARPPSDSVFMIENSAQKLADVHFLLDCSDSMVKAKIKSAAQEDKMALPDNPRFQLAKDAIQDTAEELQTDGRFRIGFSAFGHRAMFKRDSRNGPVDNDNNGIADTVPANLHPASDHQFLPGCRIADNSNTFSMANLKAFKEAVNKLEAKGRTPLYYSMGECLNELSGSDTERTKHLIVLTDGENNPFPKGEFNGLSLAPPDKDYDSLELGDLKKRFKRPEYKNVRLYLYKIVAPGDTEEILKFTDLRDWANENSRIVAKAITQDEIKNIPETILDAIGRNSYSLIYEPENPDSVETLADQKSMPTEMGNAKKGEIHEALRLGRYEVQTDSKYQSGKINEAVLGKLNFVLEGGESVAAINRKEGLFFKSKPLRFVGEPQIAVVNNTLPYEVGLVDMAKAGAAYFGFQPQGSAVSVNGEKYLFSRRYNYRPRRLWVRLIEKNTARQIDLFHPTWEDGDQQIARFDIPTDENGSPIVDLTRGDVEAQLYFQPHPMDAPPPPAAVSQRKLLLPGERSIKGDVGELVVDLNLEQKSVEVECKDFRDGFFVQGELNGEPCRCLRREIRFKQDRRVSEKWFFEFQDGEIPQFFLFQQVPQETPEDWGALPEADFTDPVF
ncbi:MAG: hypothetical protein P8M80_01415, partial [Pirellulaceae bacterium]|nr:hypothetical protein [Pirellulaceae bacterium]